MYFYYNTLYCKMQDERALHVQQMCLPENFRSIQAGAARLYHIFAKSARRKAEADQKLEMRN